MNYEIGNFLINLLETAVLYLVVPFILSLTTIKNSKHTNKWIKRVGIINAIVVFFICRIIQYSNFGDISGFSFAPAIIWGWVGIDLMTQAAMHHKMLKGEDKRNQLVQKKNTEAKVAAGLSDEEFKKTGAEGPEGYGTKVLTPIFTNNPDAYLKRLVTSEGKPVTYALTKADKYDNSELHQKVKIRRANITVNGEEYGGLYICCDAIDAVSNLYPKGYRFSENSQSMSHTEALINNTETKKEKENRNVGNEIKKEINKVKQEPLAKPVKETKVKATNVEKENKSSSEIPADQLRKLKSLYDAGILTEEEFAEKKRKVLGL